MKKINLSDLSILIPVRLDSLDRLENLIYVTDYILKYCHTSIFILHADSSQRQYLRNLINPACHYLFIEDYDPIFHRTRYLNQLFDLTSSKVVAIWDADVVISPCQMQLALSQILDKGYDISFPYDGTFLNVDDILKNLFFSYQYDIDFLLNHISKMHVLYKNVQNGGVIFISRAAFINSGKEEEDFYGWGPEDWNRLEKWKNP